MRKGQAKIFALVVVHTTRNRIRYNYVHTVTVTITITVDSKLEICISLVSVVLIALYEFVCCFFLYYYLLSLVRITAHERLHAGCLVVFYFAHTVRTLTNAYMYSYTRGFYR